MNTTLPQDRDIGTRTASGHPIQAAIPEPAPAPVGPPEPVTPNEIALHAVTHRITSLDSNTLTLANSYRALQSLHAKYSEAAVASIKWQSAASLQLGHKPTADKIDTMFHQGWGDDLTRMAQLEAGLKALECDGRLAPALELLDGLHAERHRLEAAVAADRQERAQAHQAVLDAQTAAVAKAQVAAESCPELAAARARLAAFDQPQAAAPAVPFRGQVELPAKPKGTKREPLEIETIFGEQD